MNPGEIERRGPDKRDRLTGLLDRSSLHEALLERIESIGELGPVAAVALDLDGFREVNAALSHRAGDTILIEVARRLTAAIPGAIVGRTGGDEFLVAFTVSGEPEALDGARRLLDALQPAVDALGYQVGLHASLGVALAPDHLPGPDDTGDPALSALAPASDAECLLKLADAALLRSRREHLGIAVHRPFDEDARIRRLLLVNELRQAVPRRELELRFQPIVDLREGRVTGAEALIRWRHTDHGLMLPDEFIELAELSGSIHPMTRWLVGETAAATRRLADANLPLVLSANLSVRNVLDPDLLSFFTGLVTEGTVEPGCLLLEVTESQILHDPVRGAAVVEKLRTLGIRTVVDDFGTGYSSLSYLKQLPVAGIKVDRSFVTGLPEDTTNAAIVASIVELAHRLDLTVTAEGVADEAALEAVVAFDVDFAQGFHLCEPVTVEELPGRIAELDARLRHLVPPR